MQSVIISTINSIIIQLLSFNILGTYLFNNSNYPYVDYFKEIKYFDFIERMEGLLSLEYLLCFISLFSFILISQKKHNH